MDKMPLPSVNGVLKVEEGFMDEDRPPDFFLTAPNGDTWYVSASDLQYMESRSKVNKAYLNIEKKITDIFTNTKVVANEA